MGQIVIDIPNKTNRRYNLDKSDQARTLLQFLDHLLSKNRTLTQQQMQDLKDGIESDLALDEMRRTGKTYSVDQLREEFGLS